MSVRSFSSTALVLKRVNTGELDRIITLLTPDQGKIVAVAKGVRKLESSQRAYLEPGNHVSVLFITTHTMPIITQAKLLDDFSRLKSELRLLKQLLQLLEICDQLFAEGLGEPELFAQIIEMIHHLNEGKSTHQNVQAQLCDILIQLGYQDFKETKYSTILEYVASVSERPLHSYDFLTVKSV